MAADCEGRCAIMVLSGAIVGYVETEETVICFFKKIKKKIEKLN